MKERQAGLSLLWGGSTIPKKDPQNGQGPDSGPGWEGPGLPRQMEPTSQVWARRLMAELLRPNMMAKKELRFFCSLRL